MAVKPRLLDLFCGAGGAAVGYYRAGFEVTGVDIVFQKHYPFTFIQADALEYCAAHGREFDAIHASPPCQAYSNCTPASAKGNHPRLIAATSALLKQQCRPYVIENVSGARRELNSPLMLCGTMFGLNMWRHRFFELGGFDILLTPPCRHVGVPVMISGSHRIKNRRYEDSVADRRRESGIDWMSWGELDQAVPPAYTEYIGRQLRNAIHTDIGCYQE